MKIRSIAVNQFKQFTKPMCLENIGDGLNVVVGPNEMGKSTMLDALRAALFERHNSRAQSIRDLQNNRNDAGPVVELSFEVDNGIYCIRKRFVKRPYARLFCPDGRNLEGEVAEEELRKILGFGQPGNTGANAETLGMWSVLWVRQGESFNALSLPDSARSNLHSALETEVGAVLGGEQGRTLPDTVDAQLAELMTKTGKPRGDHKAAIENLENLKQELEDLRTNRNELNTTFENLEAALQKFERLDSGEQDANDQKELEAKRKRQAELARLEEQINTAKAGIELNRNKLKQAKKDLEDRRSLKQRIRKDAEAIEAAKASFEEVRQREETLRKQVEELRKAVKDAEQADSKAVEAVSMARRILNAVQRDASISELEAHYEKACESEARMRAAQSGAAAILVREENLALMRDVASKLESAQARLSAAATRLLFDIPADLLTDIEVDGATLGSEQTSVDVVKVTAITIPKYGKIHVHPAIEDSDKLIAQQQKAQQALNTALENCGAKSIEEAELQLAERQRLLGEERIARQEVELHASATDDRQAGSESLNAHIEGLTTILDKERFDLGISKFPSVNDAEQALRDAEAASLEAKDKLATSNAALTAPQEEFGRIQKDLGAKQAYYENGKAGLKTLKDKLAGEEQKKAEAVLEADVDTARTALTEKEQAVTDLERQQEGETLSHINDGIDRLETALQTRREKRNDLQQKIAGYRSTIEASEGAGLDEAIDKKEYELDLADERLQRIEREVAVLTLLSTTLRSAESDAKGKYLAPVLNRIRPHLHYLFPKAEITIDENLHIDGIVREHDHVESFAHLSMGTQEQIAILVRLAFAEMLVEQGRPATVVLDDALAFSDDDRMKLMFDILNKVGKKVQIIVLTCREALFESIGGEIIELNPSDSEKLESA